MERTGPALAARSPELLETFGCADVVGPIDDAFGSKAGELICGHRVAFVTPTAAKYRLRACSASKQQPNRATLMPSMC